MITEISQNLYRIEVPLPNNPLKALNSYVIKSGDRTLVVDTGMNRSECREVMRESLDALGVDLKHTDFFITHMHADHCGLVANFSTGLSHIYCSGPDAGIINSGGHWREMLEYAYLNGFPEEVLEEAGGKHPGYKYSPMGYVNFSIIEDRDQIVIGEYNFYCIATPGHTDGHMCLYEPDKKILIAGDHILRDITPNISLWTDDGNPLQEYLQSLDKVFEFDIELVLPGHRKEFRDHRLRVKELKKHHRDRNEEIISILESGGQSAYRIASKMNWDMTYESWDDFPVVQKWFATGEALAHLRYLEGVGRIYREITNQKHMYILK